MALTAQPTLYAIGDAREGWPPLNGPDWSLEEYLTHWQSFAQGQPPLPQSSELEAARTQIRVVGGYMERLPLACVRAGLVDYAEKWHYTRLAQNEGQWAGPEQPPLWGWRAFHLHNETPPLHSDAMLAFIQTHGAPDILCSWGLGVSEAILEACAESFKVYYSIDAPPLRVPERVSRHFNLILVGAEWQRDEVRRRHPDILCEILTIGPEFADGLTFKPLGLPKEYDLIYVAAAQPYKRHDILLEAMARSARPLRGLCVFGHGELSDDLRQQAHAMNLDMDFIGPPGISFEEVNFHMNRAKIGIVAGVNDGCPAILTEYMLAGLPVLANSELCCGLRFITPQTGATATPDHFHKGIENLLERYERGEFSPREYALERWGWPASIRQFARCLTSAGFRSRVTRRTGD